MEIRISSKGWVVIPAKLRKKYALAPGDTVQIVDYGGVLAIVPSLENPIENAVGLLQSGASLRDELLKERTAERKRENNNL
jgi:AbrB family looped-hinge helix DNA binding protein